jgi:hypothetical protein
MHPYLHFARYTSCADTKPDHAYDGADTDTDTTYITAHKRTNSSTYIGAYDETNGIAGTSAPP